MFLVVLGLVSLVFFWGKDGFFDAWYFVKTCEECR